MQGVIWTHSLLGFHLEDIYFKILTYLFASEWNRQNSSDHRVHDWEYSEPKEPNSNSDKWRRGRGTEGETGDG